MASQDSPLFEAGLERSDGAPGVSGGSAAELRRSDFHSNPPRSWRSRARAAKASATRPQLLGAVGAVLIAFSVALIITGAVLPDISADDAAPPPPPSNRDAQGVPLDALQPTDPGVIAECRVQLGDWETYSSVALQTEQQVLGSTVASMTPDQVTAALGAFPPLAISISFWVLSSPEYPWSSSFMDAAELQVSILNAAYVGVNLSFRLEGVVGIPGTAADVTSCGLGSSSDGSAGEESLLQGLIGSVDNATTINVVVCDPEGANGASLVLGSAGYSGGDGSGGDPLTAAILLRRSALWQSRTSLVHQLGHYLGLPHPFPDSQTCKYDADAIADTPQLYIGSTGCDLTQPVPLCNTNVTLDKASLPANGFMETTNDTCRQHFTQGQVLRMRTMLRTLRPELHDASLPLLRAQRVDFASAWQSALPEEAIVQRQLSLSLASAQALVASSSGKGSSGKGSLPSAAIQAAGRLTSALDHARLAATATGGTSLDHCSCVSPDASGAAYWTGQLDGSYLIDAVSIVQPWEVVMNATQQAAIDALGAAVAAASGNSSGSGAVPPAAEGDDLQLAQGPTPVALSGQPLIDIRIGDSSNYQRNARCTKQPVTLGKLAQTIVCNDARAGQFITVHWPQPAPNAPLCLCQVAPVSFATPPLPAINPTTPTGLPGAPVNMTGAAATQSSSQNTTTGHAAMALASASTAASRSGAVRCSATAVEDTPWWSLDFGINAKLVRGVRLALPSTCIGLSQDTTQPIWNTTALNCSTGSNVILDVYVTDAPIATNSTVAKGAPKVAVPPPGAVCALQVKVSPGRVVDIDCGRFIEGSVVTVVAREQRPVSLSLCGVTPIGGEVLSVVDAMADVQQTTVPAAMMSSFVLPLDGNGETCLDVGTSGGAANATQVSQWRLQLADSYEVVGVGVAAQGPALKAELLDADDVPVWSAANVSFNSGEIVSVDPAQIVHSLRITGFSSLCEATLAVASQGAAAVPLQWKISSPANSTAWEAMVASSDNASSGVDASALVDGDLRTCVPLQPGSNASQEGNVTVQLSYILGQYSINTVHLLSNATLYNVSVAVIPDAGDGATAAQEADCDGPVTLQPWSLVPVSCGAAPQGSTLVIKVPAAQLEVPPTNGPAAGSLAPALCEVLVDGWKLEA